MTKVRDTYFIRRKRSQIERLEQLHQEFKDDGLEMAAYLAEQLMAELREQSKAKI